MWPLAMIRRIAIALPLLAVAGCGGGSESTQDAPVTAEPTTTVQVTTPATSNVESTDTETTLPSDSATTTQAVVVDGGESDEEAALTSAVSRYVAAFGEGDPDVAVSLLSERCADIVPVTEYRAAVAGAGELYPGLVVDEFSDIVLDESAAVVYYTTAPVVEADQGERWVVEFGSWRWDDC